MPGKGAVKPQMHLIGPLFNLVLHLWARPGLILPTGDISSLNKDQGSKKDQGKPKKREVRWKICWELGVDVDVDFLLDARWLM